VSATIEGRSEGRSEGRCIPELLTIKPLHQFRLDTPKTNTKFKNLSRPSKVTKMGIIARQTLANVEFVFAT
jgi:hypothetical protein